MTALLLLAAAALVAVWHLRRGRWSLVVAQAVCTLLLGMTLMPPPLPADDGTLTVWTAGVTPSRWRSFLWPTAAVALPESAAGPDIDGTPDLATALRRQPSTRRLAIVGDGLTPRDRPAAAGLPLHFAAAPLHGLVALQAPAVVQIGSQWSVDGQAAAPAERAELRDPAGAVVDAAPVRERRFRLSGVAKAPGALRFELRLLDAAGHPTDTATVPLTARSGVAMTAIVRAGSPDPDTKYWRRWAVDAGLQVRFAAALGPDMAARDGDAALTPAALDALDLVVIDERAWSALTAAEADALRAAVRGGLGLVLRCTGGALDAGVAADWAALGWTLESSEADAPPVTLDRHLGLHTDAGSRIAFTAAPVRIGADAGSTPVLRSDAGDLLAAVRDVGQGRVLLWRLQDSYRLQLAGESARYGRLWGDALAQVARARPRTGEEDHAEPLPGDRWVGERTVLCGLGGLGAEPAVHVPGGPTRPLLVDASRCAADVPTRSGWQQVVGDGGARSFFVRALDDGAGLRRARDREATLQLVNEAGDGAMRPGTTPGPRRAAPRWPFALAWLATFTWILWRENALRR